MQGEVYDGSKIDEWWQLAATMLPPGAQLEQLLELRQDASTRIVTALLNFPTWEEFGLLPLRQVCANHRFPSRPAVGVGLGHAEDLLVGFGA